MKLKVYKSKKKFLDTVRFFEDNKYEKIGKTKSYQFYNVSFSLYFDVHTKKTPDWIEEVLTLFDKEDIFDKEIPNQYNAVIVIETTHSVYLIPKGYAFWDVEKISDLEFGLDFAEKTMNSEDISMKSVSYIQRNKMRGIINYKKAQTEFPQASESYFYVSGKPVDEHIFGTNIDCGTAISFSKDYDLSEADTINALCLLFNEIDTSLKLKGKKTSIPRLHKILKKEELHNQLNEKLLNDITSNGGQNNTLLNVNRIQLIGNSLNILENEKYMTIYIAGLKSETEKRVDVDVNKVIDFIKNNEDKIKNIEKLKFSIFNKDGLPIQQSVDFMKILYSEVELDGRVYVLDNGYWGFFNDRFYELLEEKMNEIQNIVEFREEFSIQYDSYETGELAGEGGYIEELSIDKNKVKLHKRNLIISGNSIEVADIYDQKENELIAIKRGTNTSLALYSFEQSLLSVQALANGKEFNVKNELLKYNNRKEYKSIKRHPNIRDKMIDRIILCKNNSVLWLVDTSPKYIYTGVKNKTFHLNEFKSLMLKLKIVDWYSFTKDNGYTPKLYFAIDKPVKKVGSKSL
ncbi:TIGR04141 family sporadically distributed protein [Vagococcus fluvialis]|uniref:DUF6119 family protein n=1 Tax=Vagococcus fluvialis TaxID=2738 RepID=UPI0014329047|nr:DUF6119 family protein [Vagococcus fluvialis]NKC60605.1 TIGR04141 family sporadically distributed protein [Vagococcus fluvialis]NKD51411.1 TIGR04141 family sporadically distributed protein [Vagococcus fluvialis]